MSTVEEQIGSVNIGTDEVPVYESVADGSLISAEAALEASDSAFEGHVDKRWSEEVEAAMLVVQRYCEITPDGVAGRPIFVKHGDLRASENEQGERVESFMISHIAKMNGWKPAKARVNLIDGWLVDCQLKKALKEEHVIGAVSLDLAPAGNFPQDRSHPTEPKVLFIEISSAVKATRPLYMDGTREYMAVWYKPQTVVQERRDRVTGEPVKDKDGEIIVDLVPVDRDGAPLKPWGDSNRLWCDDRWVPGYEGIVGWFSDIDECRAAYAGLLAAVRTIAKPPPVADVEDAMRQELLDGDAFYDSEYEKWKATHPAGVDTPPAIDPFA